MTLIIALSVQIGNFIVHCDLAPQLHLLLYKQSPYFLVKGDLSVKIEPNVQSPTASLSEFKYHIIEALDKMEIATSNG